jgi:hypothetical protein
VRSTRLDRVGASGVDAQERNELREGPPIRSNCGRWTLADHLSATRCTPRPERAMHRVDPGCVHPCDGVCRPPVDGVSHRLSTSNLLTEAWTWGRLVSTARPYFVDAPTSTSAEVRRGGSTSMFSPSMRGVAEGSGGTQVGHPVLRARDPRRLDAICRTRTCSFPDPGPHSSRRRPRPSSEGKRPGNRVARGSFAGLCGIQPGVSPLEHQTRIVADCARCPADTHARRTGR